VTAAPAPWTRAERTREIGYAQAMLEMSQAAKELKKAFPVDIRARVDGLPPEVAYVMGAIDAGRFMDKIAEYASDAFVMYHDPAFFSECVDRLADYGPAPVEPPPGGQP
jgi:hypothetical protein